jgi:hypothetical protein
MCSWWNNIFVKQGGDTKKATLNEIEVESDQACLH